MGGELLCDHTWLHKHTDDQTAQSIRQWFPSVKSARTYLLRKILLDTTLKKLNKTLSRPPSYGGPQVTVLCVLSQSLQDYIFCQSFSLKRACCILGFFCLFFETSFKFSTDSVLETHFFFAVCQFENNISIRSPQLDIILTQFY